MLEDVVPGVVRITSTPLSFRGRAMATQLFTAPDGLLSGWSGGRLAGLRSMPTQTIHVTVPDEFRRDAPPWIDIHRTTWWDADPWSIDAFVVASPMRILFGLAQAFNQHRFERAAEDAWHLGLITPTDAAEYLERHRCRGKDGVSKIERWLDRCDGQERARAEQPRTIPARGVRTHRAPATRSPAPPRTRLGRDDPSRHRVAGDPPGGRAWSVLVPRRRSASTARSGARPRLRRARVAGHPLRRDDARRRARRRRPGRQSPRPTHRRPPITPPTTSEILLTVALSAHRRGEFRRWWGEEGMPDGADSLGCCCNDVAPDVWAPSRDLMEADHHV